MLLIELVYEEGCPNVTAARANLAWAFPQTRVSARWTEWNLALEGVPMRVRGLRSPTILINGRDVMAGCIDAPSMLLAYPTVEIIVGALRAAAAASPDIP